MSISPSVASARPILRPLPLIRSLSRHNTPSSPSHSTFTASPSPARSRSRSSTPDSRLQQVLDSLVSSTLGFASQTDPPVLPDPERTFFVKELERLVADDRIDIQDKIDGVTELADMCLGRGWESGTDVELDMDMDVDVDADADADAQEMEQPRKRTRLDDSREQSPDRCGFLQQCPEDVLFYIFSHLDARSLCRSAQACSYWNALIASLKTSVWSRLTRTTWGLSDPPSHVGMTWKEYFRVQWNLQVGRYRLRRFKDRPQAGVVGQEDDGNDRAGSATSYTSEHHEHQTPPAPPIPAPPPPPPPSAPARRRRYVAAWPADPNNAYIVALDVDNAKLAWVDNDDLFLIKVASLNDDGTLSKAVTLEGHQNTIGLILSNNEGTLVSFDDTSTIMVWNLRTMEYERTINSEEELGFIFSMNIHKRRIVTGGKNGRVIVWDADTGESIWDVRVEDKYLSGLSVQNLLNVAVWGDLVAYGVWEGGFWVGDMKRKTTVAKFSVEDMRKMVKEQRREKRRKEKRVGKEVGQIMRDSGRVLEKGRKMVGCIASAADVNVNAHVPLQMQLQNMDTQNHANTAINNITNVYDTITNIINQHMHTGEYTTGISTEGMLVDGGQGSSSTAWRESAGIEDISDTDSENSFSLSSSSSTSDTESEQGEPMENPFTTTTMPLALPALPAIPQNNIFPLDRHRTLFPMTLALNGHILLTNGPERYQLGVWDLRGERPLFVLDSREKKRRRRRGVEERRRRSAGVEPGRADGDSVAVTGTGTGTEETGTATTPRQTLHPPDLKFAELSRDGTMVFASVFHPLEANEEEWEWDARRECEFLVWDFAANNLAPDGPDVDVAVVQGTGAAAGVSVDGQGKDRWGFDRKFEKVVVGRDLEEGDEEGDGILVWVCWDEC